MIKLIRTVWCSWFHGGGRIYTDRTGTYWRCVKCWREIR